MTTAVAEPAVEAATVVAVRGLVKRYDDVEARSLKRAGHAIRRGRGAHTERVWLPAP